MKARIEVTAMIQPEMFDAPTRPRSFKVIQGGQEFDLERFAGTLAALESYVDSVLAAEALPAMDPWVDDELMDVRLASI